MDLFAPDRAENRIRNQRLPVKVPVLDYFGTSQPRPVADTHTPFCAHVAEGAFTTENWIVHTFRVKGEDYLGVDR